MVLQYYVANSEAAKLEFPQHGNQEKSLYCTGPSEHCCNNTGLQAGCYSRCHNIFGTIKVECDKYLEAVNFLMKLLHLVWKLGGVE